MIRVSAAFETIAATAAARLITRDRTASLSGKISPPREAGGRFAGRVSVARKPLQGVMARGEGTMRGAVRAFIFLLAVSVSSRCSAQQKQDNPDQVISADEFLANYRASPSDRQIAFDDMLVIAETAFSYYRVSSGVKLYCPPERLGLTGQQDFYILSRQVASDQTRALSGTPWVLAFLSALERTLPCT